MGESALRSHMAGSKHRVNVKSNGTASTMKPFLQRKHDIPRRILKK